MPQQLSGFVAGVHDLFDEDSLCSALSQVALQPFVAVCMADAHVCTPFAWIALQFSLPQFIVTYPEFPRWLIKIDSEFSGRGIAYLEVSRLRSLDMNLLSSNRQVVQAKVCALG